MRKLSVIVFALLVSAAAFAQNTTPKKSVPLVNRAADHFMFQLAANFWSGTADSVKNYVNSFNRSANAYIMIDKPFKGNQKFSAAIGVGVGTANIYFDKMETKIAAFNNKLPFIRTDTGNHYKKYKLATAYLEAPIELRFMSRPQTPNKSWKGAIGVKLGTLLSAHTKGKTLENSTGTKLNGFSVKENTRQYFNSTRLAATARVGYGIFSLFGSYSITNVFKDGVAPDIKGAQIGLTISGL